MKRIVNRKEDHPCIDFDISGNVYHVWHLARRCASGELVAIDVRIPGIIQGGSARNGWRREIAAARLHIARHQLRQYVLDAGGLAPRDYLNFCAL